MKEVRQEYRSFKDGYGDAIGLCFLDKEDNGFLITACYYTKRRELPLLPISINGKIENAKPFHSQKRLCDDEEINLNYFHIRLTSKDLEKKQKIQLSSPFFTHKEFPIDKGIKSYFILDSSIIYFDSDALIVAPACKSEKRIAKASHRRGRWQMLKSDPSLAIKGEAFRLIYRLLKHFYRKEIWLISDRIDSAGDNGQALFEYLASNTPKGVKPYFVINKKAPQVKELKRVGKVLHPRTLKYKIHWLLAKKNIGSQLEYHITTPIYVGGYLNHILYNQKIVFLQHGIIKDDLSPLYNRYDKNFHMFVTSTVAEHKSIAQSVAYGYGDRVKLTGLARFDKLDSESNNIIFIAPSWRKSCIKDTETGEPTEDFKNSSFFDFYRSLLNNDELISTAKETGYKLCFYPHPIMRRALFGLAPEDEIFLSPNDYSYSRMFKEGSLLFTDYSSVQFDFAYLKKPVIYCQFDKEEFYQNHTYVQGYFDYERDGFGEVCYDVEKAVMLLCQYMRANCPMKEEYIERVNNTFKYKDKLNCERIVKEILSL